MPADPNPLSAQDIELLDPNFRDRALELMRDAEKKAKRKKIGVALKQYWNDLDFKEFMAETAVKTVGTLGVYLASGAVVAAGVASGAVTFGIGPAIGIVTGIIIAKSINEVKYQKSSNRFKKRIRGAYGEPLDMSDLPDAVNKVLKKYVRVMRRAKQVLGGGRGIGYNLRHAVTTGRSKFRQAKQWWKRRHGEELVGDQLSNRDDPELNFRLLELRYYGQLTFNLIDQELQAVINKRNNLVQQAQRTFAHVVRQVHFTGNHSNCSDCYTLSQSQFRQNLSQVRPAPDRGNVLTRGYHKRKHFKDQRSELSTHELPVHGAVHFHQNAGSAAVNLGQFHQHLSEEQEWAYPQADSGWRGTRNQQGIDRGQDYISNALGNVGGAGAFDAMADATTLSASRSDVAETVGKALWDDAGVTAGNVGIAVAIDQALGFVRTRIDRRLARSRVLGKKSDIIRLLEQGDDATNQECQALRELIESNDKDYAPRIVEKILWYLKKIDRLEQDPKYTQLVARIAVNDFRQSAFGSCDEAYTLWRLTHYLLRQYHKMITNMVFLEVILLQSDRKVADIGIGVPNGTLVRDGNPIIRPPHLSD